MPTVPHSPHAPRSFHTPNLRTAALIFFSLFLLSFQPAFAKNGPGGKAPFAQDGRGFEDAVDPAIAFFEALGLDPKHLRSGGAELDLDTPITLDHIVPLPHGQHLFVQETFTINSWLHRPARAVLFLSGSVFRGNHWSIPVKGYNGTAMAAERGYFAFTVDYLGVGASSKPEDGFEVTRDGNREAMKVLLRYIRYFRDVPRVDLVGAGYGASIAIQLAADPGRVRSVSAGAVIYNVVTAGPLTNPDFVEMLRNSPTGYFFAPGFGSLFFMADAPQAARDFVAATQGGLYPVGNFLIGADLPNLDPSVARAPGLFIHGDLDFIAPADDIRQLAADYGTHGARYVSHPDAGHPVRIESPELAAWYWQTVFDFMEMPH